MKIIGLIIAVVLYAVPFVVLTHFVKKELKKLELKINNVNDDMLYIESDLRHFKGLNGDRYQQFVTLVRMLDMKIETDWIGKTTIKELSELEKKAKELREQADELEREQQ